ncbi:heat-inducible transcription repressor HrcA [Clostridium sp. D2Q-11]|uniref:Heat-inducible transcription repressor HrcA n=1 Tax=Anaeromonas frigoriresistens TaxID=2683708 RepID=A0A942Z7H6_9FIRM|nr:heat-inducible transcriptional repressor HrcA [Anaeromonas frigoriresistens]MBS4536874.1 heat-inducible transcription repressor HrcA [Anaeromonas frigoriresistens]
MKIDGRKLKILQAIIHNYITNAEPIGSRTISKRYDLGVSPATIRNEMSDLEELGYLLQPHTSAGRVPSNKAYRLYVDGIIQNNNKDKEIMNKIDKKMLDGIGQMEELIENSASILSQLTNYTSLAIAPQLKLSKLKHVQVVPVDDFRVLLVIVTDSGIVKNTILRLDRSIPNDQLNMISNLLTSKLKGQAIGHIGRILQTDIIKDMHSFRDTINVLIRTINESSNNSESVELYSDGITKIFNFPEYNDISKAKSFLSFIENKDNVIKMLMSSGLDNINNLGITIGEENSYDEIKNCSLITATYKINGKTIGKIGVIGPTRMEYSKVIPVVQSISLDLSDILNKYFE